MQDGLLAPFARLNPLHPWTLCTRYTGHLANLQTHSGIDRDVDASFPRFV